MDYNINSSTQTDAAGNADIINAVSQHDATGKQVQITNEALRDWKSGLPKKQLTGAQMMRVLKICGKKVRDFAKFLDRSDNYVRQTLGYNPEPIPLTYYDALKHYVGEENFLCALREQGVEP
jgi:hypothetical protein